MGNHKESDRETLEYIPRGNGRMDPVLYISRVIISLRDYHATILASAEQSMPG